MGGTKLKWLSNRERLVLKHLMEGRSAEEISKLEHLSLSTVRTYVRGILIKLNVNTQLQAVAYAYSMCWPVDTCMETAMTETLRIPA
jgi:DNA-binding CsgD family transcriptional regulator